MKVLIVIPAHNEARIIRQTVAYVTDFLYQQSGLDWHLVVAENGSCDETVEILKELAQKYPQSRFSFESFPRRSKSDAIKHAWLSWEADLYIHMDADLATDLRHLPELVDGIRAGYDLVIGSRCLPKSDVERSIKRDLISCGYNLLTRLLFALDIKDLQCGFKAVNRRTRDTIIRQTRHISEGFMDTEMLILASVKGYKIKEIPVRWREKYPSKFKFWQVAVLFIRNLLCVKRDLLRGRYA